MAPQRTATAHNQAQCQGAAAGSGAAGPAASTAATAQQHHQQQQHAFGMVMPLLLQHDSVRTQLRLVCSLLCCSKAVAAAVAEHCVGQLNMPLQPLPVLPHLVSWLRKHARLVRSLDLRSDSYAAEHVVPGLLAAGPQGLQLQALQLRSLQVESNTATLELLEQLPARCLTRLDLELEESSAQPHDLAASMAQALSAALGRLTALRTLALCRPPATLAGWLPVPPLAGLAALTQLTSLTLAGPLADLQHAPPQLLELDLQYRQQQPLELSGLTALTALTCVEAREGDVLPANLLALNGRACRSVQPLLPLVRLQQLRVSFGEGTHITADQLRQLSRLTALSLDQRHQTEPPSTASWPLLPLQRLQLRSAVLSATVCQSLAQLSGLTSLQLSSPKLPQAASAQQLAAALRRLSGLQQLHSTGWWSAAAMESSHGMQQLVQAVGSLQHLRELEFRLSSQLAAAAAAPGNSLAALTGLTGLSLALCQLEDAAVAALVSQLPGLQRLDCCGNRLTDAELSAIGRLHQLTELLLNSTRVGDAGMKHLTGLVQLKKLNLFNTGVTDAGMLHLTGLAGLQALCVPDCVSLQQKRWLKQQLPELTLL